MVIYKYYLNNYWKNVALFVINNNIRLFLVSKNTLLFRKFVFSKLRFILNLNENDYLLNFFYFLISYLFKFE